MANNDTSQPRADQDFESYADDAKARRVLIVDGSGNVSSVLSVKATDLDIRDLTHISDSITVGDGISTAAVTTNVDDDTNLDGENGVIVDGVLYARIDSDKVKPVRMDAITHTLQTIDYEHHEIHAGSHFFICGFRSVAGDTEIDFVVRTPDISTWSHMTFKIEGISAVSMKVLEGATIDTVGAAVTAINSNRNSAQTSVLSITQDDILAYGGELIYSNHSGARKVAGIVKRAHEIILKQDTVYVFRITEESGQNNIISFCGTWYEHTNKD